MRIAERVEGVRPPGPLFSDGATPVKRVTAIRGKNAGAIGQRVRIGNIHEGEILKLPSQLAGRGKGAENSAARRNVAPDI
jgi:hypothetical protein